MSNRWRTAAALLFLLALTIGIYWPLTLSHDYSWLENPDQGLQVRPWLDYEAREVHAGRVPLWDPYLWGQSLIAQVQPGVANPLNWILFLMPLRDGHIPIATLHWYWVLIHWFAAVFAFLLCRDLGCGFIASTIGGSIFGFAGFMGYSLCPQFLMSALWLPLVLLFLARVFRAHRPFASAALAGAFMGLAFLSGHHNVPIYFTVVAGVLWLWLVGSAAIAKRLPGVRKTALQAALFFGVVFLVSAVQTFPAIEYGRVSLRWSGYPEPQHWHDKLPYVVHAEFSLTPESIPGMAISKWKSQTDPYVGIVACVLALLALLALRRSRMVRLFAVVAGFGLLLALGKNTPVHHLVYDFVPMVDKARYPAMCIGITHIAIAALAAMGLQNIASVTRPKTLAACLAPLALLLFLVEVVQHPIHFDRFDRPGSFVRLIAEQSDIADYLRRQSGWFRIHVDQDVVPYNFGDWYGIEQFNGYVASLPINVSQMNGPIETPGRLGIRYHIGKTPFQGATEPVFVSRSGITVFRNPSVTEPLRADHDKPCPGADQFRILERVSNAFVIDADLACPGAVVTGDPYYRGWRAWIDGRRVIVASYEAGVRAVTAPAGHHRIEFRYRPGSVYYGAVLSVLGLALTAFVCSRDRSLAA